MSQAANTKTERSRKPDREWSDRLNPLLVQEMRRATRNRGMIFLGGGLLLALLACTWWSGVKYERLGVLTGPEFFLISYYAYTIPVFLVVPVYVAVRIHLEREQGWLELLVSTGMTPHKIILGKVCSGLLIAMFFLGFAAPFFFSSFLFRGINVFQVAYILSLNIILLLGAIYWVMFWAVLKVGPVFKTILWCIGIAGLLGGLMMALGLGTAYIKNSVGGDGLLLVFLGVFYFIGILFAHTIAMDQIRNIDWHVQYYGYDYNRFDQPPASTASPAVPE